MTTRPIVLAALLMALAVVTPAQVPDDSLKAIAAVTTADQLEYAIYVSERCEIDETDVRADTERAFMGANIERAQQDGDWALGISIQCLDWDGVLAFKIDLVFTNVIAKPKTRLNWNHGIYGAGDPAIVLAAYKQSIRSTLATYNLAHSLHSR